MKHTSGKKYLVRMYSSFLEYEKGEKMIQLRSGNKFERVSLIWTAMLDTIFITGDLKIRQVLQGLVTGVLHGRGR